MNLLIKTGSILSYFLIETYFVIIDIDHQILIEKPGFSNYVKTILFNHR